MDYGEPARRCSSSCLDRPRRVPSRMASEPLPDAREVSVHREVPSREHEPMKTAEAPLIAPLDEHNATLVRNVHPSDWRPPTPARRYNLVVIGAGTAGLVTAAGAAGLGARGALVGRHLLGGDCLNVGCVPSKCIIRSSRGLGDIAAAAALGVHVPPGIEADFGAVMERMRRLRARISHHDSVGRFTRPGVYVFPGSALFVRP